MKQKQSLKLLIISIILSTILHLFVMYRYKTPKIDPPQTGQRQSSSNGRGEDIQDKKTSIWFTPGIVPCDSYDGIGLQFNAISGIVTYVAGNAPADLAGIKVGDELITPLWNMELTFGQSLDVIVLRDGKKITLSVVVDRICHE
jgi:hypothetical protein